MEPIELRIGRKDYRIGFCVARIRSLLNEHNAPLPSMRVEPMPEILRKDGQEYAASYFCKTNHIGIYLTEFLNKDVFLKILIHELRHWQQKWNSKLQPRKTWLLIVKVLLSYVGAAAIPWIIISPLIIVLAGGSLTVAENKIIWIMMMCLTFCFSWLVTGFLMNSWDNKKFFLSLHAELDATSFATTANLISEWSEAVIFEEITKVP